MSNYSQRLLMNSTIHIAQRRTFSLQRAHNYVLLLYGAKKNVKSLHYHRFKQFIGTVGKTTVQCTCHRYPPQQRMYASMHTGSMSKNRGGKVMVTHWMGMVYWRWLSGANHYNCWAADPAPEKLLKLIFCGCQIGYMSACSCRRY